jgi:hypothetical protein
MHVAVVSLRPMFIPDTTNDNTTVTNRVTGRWWLPDEHEQVHKH